MKMRETSRAIDKKLWVNNNQKKVMSKIPELKKDYYESGRKLGTNEGLLNYIWDYVVQPQLG